MTEKQRPYYVCDGCGYTIDEQSKYGMLTLEFKPRYRGPLPAVKHFHAPRPLGSPPTTPSKSEQMIQDCLSYWWTSRRARQIAEGEDWK